MLGCNHEEKWAVFLAQVIVKYDNNQEQGIYRLWRFF